MSEEEASIPARDQLHVTLPSFEGPLDLLLHLVQKHELDILDLPIAFVTERYLAYLDVMKQLDLDVASEYLVMAATLAHIKSKLLLPAPPAGQDEETLLEEIDPRAELIRRLLDYQRYKKVGEELGARGVAGRDVFLRGAAPPESEGPAPLAEIGLFKLLDAFQAALKKRSGIVAFEVSAERVSIQDRITQITERLRLSKQCTLASLLDQQPTVYEVVVTFLALLEMAKMHLVRVYQPDPLAEIFLESAVADATPEEAAAELAGAAAEETQGDSHEGSEPSDGA
jgi:segregation and condensation protein A